MQSYTQNTPILQHLYFVVIMLLGL